MQITSFIRVPLFLAACAGIFSPVIFGQDQKAPIAPDKSTLTQPTVNPDKKIEGFGVIDRVISTGPEPVFQADGYHIRIAATTVTKFASGLKSISEVGTNTWLHYEGRSFQGGILLATQVSFVKARHFKVVPAEPDTLPTQPSRIDSNGKMVSMRTKVRLGDAGWCGWHKVVLDQSMQERVRRVGMKVIPEYQRQLSDDSPSKIHFRIYVVDDPVFREDLECTEGLILVPRQVVERLRNEDQLAAIMANGVAWSMEMQSARLYLDALKVEGAEVLGFVAGGFVPGGDLVAGDVSGRIVNHLILKRMQEQAGRIALTLMADEGYDPRQSPEAWKLLAPKKLPKDLNELKYPSRAEYQLSILKLRGEPGLQETPVQ